MADLQALHLGVLHPHRLRWQDPAAKTHRPVGDDMHTHTHTRKHNTRTHTDTLRRQDAAVETNRPVVATHMGQTLLTHTATVCMCVKCKMMW